ncbi:MAG: hypothetical protein R2830_09185 [Saprospiraceae bacterium]
MNIQELLWKYAEGQCSEPEKAEMERILVADESLREELRLVQEVQSALAGMEVEQPSMRFAQNVMEALPKKLYAPTAIEPLLPDTLKTLFWAIVGVLVMMVALVGKVHGPVGGQLPYFDKLAASLDVVARLVPADMALYFVLVFLALTVLLMFDRLLAKGKWQVHP